MAKFKIKGIITAELPELEVEAGDIEEAREKYGDMFGNGEIDFEEYELDCGEEDDDEDVEDEEETEEDKTIEGGWIDDKCKLWGIPDKEFPQEARDSIEYYHFYIFKGYEIKEGVQNHTDVIYRLKEDRKQKKLF